ncbi:hypothetical protein ACFL7M_00495 [Thermodesulfobacteriota bacterium]
MKKLFLLVLIGLFLSGCGTLAERSEFWKHDSMYKNWDHTKYSWSGYRIPTQQTYKKSQGQEWWGIPIEE